MPTMTISKGESIRLDDSHITYSSSDRGEVTVHIQCPDHVAIALVRRDGTEKPLRKQVVDLHA